MHSSHEEVHKFEILKQDTSEAFLVDPKLETKLFVEREPETDVQHQELKDYRLPTHLIYCYVQMVFCYAKS